MVTSLISEPRCYTVKLSDVLRRGKRLDATAFDSEAMRAGRFVENGKFGTVPLGSLLDNAYFGPRLKRHYVDKTHANAIGLVGSSEMLDCQPRPVKFMVDDAAAAPLHVKAGTVLVSRSGTIGNVVLAGKTLEKCLVSEHSIRLECHARPGYVYAFLRSDEGRRLVESNTFGAVVQHVTPDQLCGIPVPDAPVAIQERINALIIRSYELRDDSNELIDEATRMMINALSLPPIEDFDLDLLDETASVETYTVRSSDMALRADASYHVPVVRAIMKHLEESACEIATVGDIRVSSDVILPGRFKRVYVEPGHGTVFIGGKQIWELDPSNKKYLSNMKHGGMISSQLVLHENMILVTCSGTVGKVAIVPRHWEGWTANQHVIRIVPSQNGVAGYLFTFLNSEYGRLLIKRNAYGSVIDEINEAHMRSVPVPLLADVSLQARINELALEANAKRALAYELEQEGLRMMDKEVLHAV